MALSLPDALGLLDELIAGYSDQAFQRSLALVYWHHGDDERALVKARRALTLSVQAKVLPKYGFEPTHAGVHRSFLAYQVPELLENLDVMGRNEWIHQLVHKGPKQAAEDLKRQAQQAKEGELEENEPAARPAPAVERGRGHSPPPREGVFDFESLESALDGAGGRPAQAGATAAAPELVGGWRPGRRCCGDGRRGELCMASMRGEGEDGLRALLKLRAGEQEVAAVRGLQGSHGLAPCLGVPEVLQIGEYGHSPFVERFVVMEPLGEPLSDLLERLHALPPRVRWRGARPLGCLLLRRLRAIHGRGLVLGGLGPWGVFLGKAEGTSAHRVMPFVADFGRARPHAWGGADALGGSDGGPDMSSAETVDFDTARAVEGDLGPALRDDLESLGWLLCFVVFGELPWSERTRATNWANATARAETIAWVRSEKRKALSNGFENHHGSRFSYCPPELAEYLACCRDMEAHGAAPDYAALEAVLAGAPAPARLQWMLGLNLAGAREVVEAPDLSDLADFRDFALGREGAVTRYLTTGSTLVTWREGEASATDSEVQPGQPIYSTGRTYRPSSGDQWVELPPQSGSPTSWVKVMGTDLREALLVPDVEICPPLPRPAATSVVPAASGENPAVSGAFRVRLRNPEAWEAGDLDAAVLAPDCLWRGEGAEEAEGEAPYGNYYLAGPRDQPLRMAWDGRAYRCQVPREGGSFRILLEADPRLALWPDVSSAHPGLAHGLRGPGGQGQGLCWALPAGTEPWEVFVPCPRGRPLCVAWRGPAPSSGAPLAAPAAALETAVDRATGRVRHLSIGTCIGPWQVVGLLGMGREGGAVYLAQWPGAGINGLAAVKFPAELGELRNLALVQDLPGVTELLDFGAVPGGLYLAMRALVPSLEDVLSSCDHGGLGGFMSWEAAQGLGRGLVSALRAVHERGLAHRDIKPGNILLDPSGAPVLADFGRAVALNADRRDSAPAADLEAVGTLLLHCLLGKGEQRGRTERAHLQQLQKRLVGEEASAGCEHCPPELADFLHLAHELRQSAGQLSSAAYAKLLALLEGVDRPWLRAVNACLRSVDAGHFVAWATVRNWATWRCPITWARHRAKVPKDHLVRVTGQTRKGPVGELWLEVDPVWAPGAPEFLLRRNWVLAASRADGELLRPLPRTARRRLQALGGPGGGGAGG